MVGGNPMSGEDTELFARIIARGGKMGFVPRAIVHHLIGAERMTRRIPAAQELRVRLRQRDCRRQESQPARQAGEQSDSNGGAAMRGDREGVVYHQLECANFFGYWRGRVANRGSH